MAKNQEDNVTEINTDSTIVTMADGSAVNFGKKGILKKSVEIIGEGADAVVNVLFNVRNGAQHRMEITSEHPAYLHLAGHGASQKVGDAASGCSPEDASIAIVKAIESLAEGKWVARASGAAKGMTDFLTAVLAVKGLEKDSEEGLRVVESMKALDDDAVKAIKGMAEVKAEMARISYERAQAKVEAVVEADEVAVDAFAAL